MKEVQLHGTERTAELRIVLLIDPTAVYNANHASELYDYKQNTYLTRCKLGTGLRST